MSNTLLKTKKVVESVITENHRKSAINYINLAIQDCKRRVIKKNQVIRSIVTTKYGGVVFDNNYGSEYDELNKLLFKICGEPQPPRHI